MKKMLMVISMVVVMAMANVTQCATIEPMVLNASVIISETAENLTISNKSNTTIYVDAPVTNLTLENLDNVIIVGLRGETITIKDSTNCTFSDVKLSNVDTAITVENSQGITFNNTTIFEVTNAITQTNSQDIAFNLCTLNISNPSLGNVTYVNIDAQNFNLQS